MDFSPLILTLQLATVTTVILLPLGIAMAYGLTYTTSRWKPVWEALVSMPLVLPPTVLGFYLLVAFSPNNGFGAFLDKYLGLKLVFTFEGLVLASVVYSLPFMVHPIQSGLNNLPHNLKEAAYLMGKSRTSTLFRVLLPNCKSSLLIGAVLAFAHTIGEFGVVLMIGGNLPGRTQVASMVIYDKVETMDYAGAHHYSLLLFAMTFTILVVVYVVNGGYFKRFSI